MEDGGYKDIDIETKISSLKVKWVSRLLDDNFHPWKIIPNLFFSRVGGNKAISHFNLQLSEACLAKIKSFPLFYQQLIQTWAEVSKRDPTQTSDLANEICKEVLWNNSYITCGGKSLYNQYFMTKGIICIIDIMEENGILLKWAKAKQKYDLNISSYLSWLGLIKSIPTAWKFNLRDSLLANPLRIDLQNESMACISSKMAYQKLIEPLSKLPTSQLYSEKVLGFGKVEWENVYMLPRIVTIESSLRSFQYKILNNILYLNERLFKFNIVDSPLCSLCGAYNESIKHLVCTCTVTQRLWDQVRSWLYEVISFPILEPKKVILGLPSETTSNYILINHIILLFKRFIFLKEKKENILALTGLR